MILAQANYRSRRDMAIAFSCGVMGSWGADYGRAVDIAPSMIPCGCLLSDMSNEFVPVDQCTCMLHA